MEASPDLSAKRAALDAALRAAGRVLIAFSGGVDSSYLAYAAHRLLGEDALAVTAESPSYPASHRSMAERVVREFAIPHRFVATRELSNPNYRVNAPDRCYHCKSELFEVLGSLRDEMGFDAV
ncbi:MAG: TIGR00268 family protein, partial [Deltaproteobacteria bacterium]|nr:TIGR00268 family protein [Deltaproteobacteria bacterium]